MWPAFLKLHWFWKFLIITGTFGVANSAIRAIRGCPDYYRNPLRWDNRRALRWP